MVTLLPYEASYVDVLAGLEPLLIKQIFVSFVLVLAQIGFVRGSGDRQVGLAV